MKKQQEMQAMQEARQEARREERELILKELEILLNEMDERTKSATKHYDRIKNNANIDADEKKFIKDEMYSFIDEGRGLRTAYTYIEKQLNRDKALKG